MNPCCPLVLSTFLYGAETWPITQWKIGGECSRWRIIDGRGGSWKDKVANTVDREGMGQEEQGCIIRTKRLTNEHDEHPEWLPYSFDSVKHPFILCIVPIIRVTRFPGLPGTVPEWKATNFTYCGHCFLI